ncbi:MAG: hypothetical protein AB7I18_01965 [Candidatus Berkiella sp.]
MNMKSGPSKPVTIQRQSNGFFDLPPAPQAESCSAPSHFDMTQVKNSLTNKPDDDDNELDEHWFTLPPLDDTPSSPLLVIINGFLKGLESLQTLNARFSSSSNKAGATTSSRSSSSSTHSQADDKTLVFNKKGSKAEIIATMKLKIEVLLVKREREPFNYNNLTLVNELDKIFKEALTSLKKRIEFNKDTTNIIKSRIEGFREELKPFKISSSAPTSARSSYRK